MKRFLTTLAIALPMLAIVPSLRIAPAIASMDEAYDHAEVAFSAIDERADWDTGIINLRRAIEASDDECMDSYYSQILDLAIEAKNRRNQGASEQSTYRWFNYELNENVHEDCQGDW